MAPHSRYAVTVSAAVATRSRADCSSMEDHRGNKRPYQPKHSPSYNKHHHREVGPRHLGVAITEQELSVSHRLGRKAGNNPRPIIAKFVILRDTKTRLVRSRKNLEGLSLHKCFSE